MERSVVIETLETVAYWGFRKASRRDFIKQRRIIVSCPGLIIIDPPRHRPASGIQKRALRRRKLALNNPAGTRRFKPWPSTRDLRWRRDSFHAVVTSSVAKQPHGPYRIPPRREGEEALMNLSEKFRRFAAECEAMS